MKIGGAKVTNYDKRGHGNITVEKAFAYSSNTAFGQIAERLGAESLVGTANAFGFGTDIGQDFGTNPSLMPNPKEMTVWETAWAGVGQPVGEHESPAGPQASVTQMALVAAGIANGGNLVKPHVVEKIKNLEGITVSKTASLNLGAACSPDVAAQVCSAMRSVVKTGTGQLAQISGVDVFGKTGTAQINDKDDHSWFIGTAAKDGKEVSIAIIVEKHQGTVSVTPQAKKVLEVALTR
jgi:peptidoglycan glycosyltransferase